MSAPQRKPILVQLKAAGEGQADVTAMAYETLHRDGDWVLRGAVPDGTRGPVYRAHTGFEGQPSLGYFESRNEGTRMQARIHFNLDSQAGREGWLEQKFLFEHGVHQELSIGYVPTLGTVTPELREKGVRRVLAPPLEVLELSFVLRGASPSTGVAAVKCNGCGRSPSASCSCAGKKSSELSAEEIFRRGKRVAAEAKALLKATEPRVPTQRECDAMMAKLDSDMARITAFSTPVSDAKRRLARQWTDAAAAYWGVPSPRIAWGVSSMKAMGEYDRTTPGVIYIAPTVSMRDIGQVCAHEVSHYARALRGLNHRDERGVEADTEYLMRRLA